MEKTGFAIRFLGAVTAVFLAASLTGCIAAADFPEAVGAGPGADPGGQYSTGDSSKALVLLEGILVKGRVSKTGYSRDEFGPAWEDTDHNGCDTRNDILARDLTDETFKPGTNNCVVTTGTLADKYTGTTISFIRGHDTSTAVQIDHIVPLSDAWQKGAQHLTAERRGELANDPLNLQATNGPTNSAKSGKDAASWLPPNHAFRCEYAARQIIVKIKYKLWVTEPELEAIAYVLKGCE